MPPAEYYVLARRACQNDFAWGSVASRQLFRTTSRAQPPPCALLKPESIAEAMDQQNAEVEFSATPAKDIQLTMRRMERREWWLWSYAVMVTLLLLIAVASFAFP